MNINLHSDLSVTLDLATKKKKKKKTVQRRKNKIMMLKLKNKESGYLSMGAIPKVKEEDRDWGGCRKAILESRKH